MYKVPGDGTPGFIKKISFMIHFKICNRGSLKKVFDVFSFQHIFNPLILFQLGRSILF